MGVIILLMSTFIEIIAHCASKIPHPFHTPGFVCSFPSLRLLQERDEKWNAPCIQILSRTKRAVLV